MLHAIGWTLGLAVASTAPEFPQLHIQERIEYYDVVATDRAGLLDALRVPGTEPDRQVNGQTHAVFEIDRRLTQTRERCVIGALSIRLELKVILPRWMPGAGLPRSLEKDWIAIHERIVMHEDRHKRNALEAAFSMRDGFLAAARKPSCIEVERALNRAQTVAINRQQLMDRLLDQRPVIGR